MSKRIIILSLIIICFSVNVFAKYNYTYVLNAYSLTRDNSEITYDIIKSIGDGEYTNQDVELEIRFNKPIGKIDGFDISEDNKILNKTLTENEAKTIIVEDISGNTKEVYYNVNNIDKIPPEIIGVEDGKTYSSNVTLEYKDNVGIKDITIDKYSSLKLNVHDDYYDTGFFKGIDITKTTAKLRVVGHPKNTVKYKYYLNNELKGISENTVFQFTGLTKGTTYTAKVEAIDSTGKVLETATRNIKTKLFTSVTGTKNSTDGTFKVTVTGIDNSIDKVTAVAFTNTSSKHYTYPSINSDRSITVTFSAKAITGNIQNGYYYFHLQLFDNEKGGMTDIVCCNVIFGEEISESTGITTNLYNLTNNGSYQIIVTDFAGNKTQKSITISK